MDTVHIINDNAVTATKIVSVADPYMPGHYPNQPIYPGVFVVESARQAVEHLVSGVLGQRSVHLRGIESARFLQPLLDGTQLTIAVTCTPPAEGLLSATVVCNAPPGDQLVARLSLVLQMSPA